jgi:chromosome segregation ATPase
MFNKLNRKMEEAGADGAESGGAGEAAENQCAASGGEDYKAQLEALQQEKSAMQAKMDELLTETKRAKEQRRQAEEAARLADEEKAKKAGDFEQLYKSSEEKSASLAQQLEELRSGIANEKRQNMAQNIAAELADGANAKLLSEFVAKRLKVTDEEIKVVDKAGNLSVATIDDLKKEFATDATFASLLRGSKATGGGAAGGSNGGGAAKEISRSEFDAMDSAAKVKFAKAGGQVIN